MEEIEEDKIGEEEDLQRVKEEIEVLHLGFVSWFNGTCEHHELNRLIGDRMTEGFFYVMPGASKLDKQTLLKGLATQHGSNPSFRISITDIVIRHKTSDGAILATYTEHQTGAKNSVSDNWRTSTAFFIRSHDGSLLWHLIQETALP